MNKRAARLRLAVQAPAITTMEQGGTQSARERAVAAEPLGDSPLSPVRLYLSCNANVYRRYPYIDGFSLFVYLQYRKVSVLLRKVYFHLLTLKAKKGGLTTLYAIIKAEKNKEKEPKPRVRFRFLLAEGEGFEPPDPCRSSVFKTDAIDLSANLPC